MPPLPKSPWTPSLHPRPRLLEPRRHRSPRELASAGNADVYLYKPPPAFRLRGRDFEIPSQAPVGQNPRSPVVLDYFLKTAPEGEVTLEILDTQGKLVRKYSSQEPKKKRQVAEIESEFEDFMPSAAPKLPVKAGMNRFTWDARYEAPVHCTPHRRRQTVLRPARGPSRSAQ